MSVDRDVVRVAVPPILAACVVALIVGPPPEEQTVQLRELVGVTAGGSP